jgi:hypothetical protein
LNSESSSAFAENKSQVQYAISSRLLRDGILRVAKLPPHNNHRKPQEHRVENAYARELKASDFIVDAELLHAHESVDNNRPDHRQEDRHTDNEPRSCCASNAAASLKTGTGLPADELRAEAALVVLPSLRASQGPTRGREGTRRAYPRKTPTTASTKP